MPRDKEVRLLAAEITVGLLGVAPGTSIVIGLLPETSKRAMRRLFGADRADSLQLLVQNTLDEIVHEILSALNAEPGSHEYGATYSAISDFRVSLSRTPLDSKLMVESLSDRNQLVDAIRKNCPEEHQERASKLRRRVFTEVLERVCEGILALAPQVPSIQSAVAVETLKRIVEIQEHVFQSEGCPEPKGGN